ncbi:MAG: transketolase [Nitrospirae bacterium]|nr:transketolase [Nitrospirota bacterium]
MTGKRVMRDVFIESIYNRMFRDEMLFFLCADFGSPKLDRLRAEFGSRFINVGIAEQNLINIATGLALEGFTVYAYAIAPFLVMRAYEQIRNNLSLLSHIREINVNLIGVGAGLSYDVSGPTHHCIEDISAIRTLPNITIFSPSDWVLVETFVDYSINNKCPKYIRLDGKPLPKIYNTEDVNLERGFFELVKGSEVCIVSTGYMTHTALRAIERLGQDGISCGLVDVFMIRPIGDALLLETLSRYKCVINLEEGFINKGGLDSMVSCILNGSSATVGIKKMGFGDEYSFDMGGRLFLHKSHGIDEDGIIKNVKDILKGIKD